MEYDRGIDQQTETEEAGKVDKGREAYEDKVSAYELPTSKDIASTYIIVGAINHEDNWILGKIDDTHLSLNYFLLIESSNYRISVNDISYRMIVNKYDQNKKYIGYVDLSDGDILHLDASESYITVTIYKYTNRQRVDHYYQEILNDLNNGLKFSITKIDNLDEHIADKELLTAEVHTETLSNYYNYRVGWFKSWGGAYENRDGSLCTRNFYKVDSKPYIFNVNDSRILLSISEYDATGKWLKFNGGLTNGSTFTKQTATSYIGLTIRSQKWGVDLKSLFENGLKLDLASDQNIEKTETISFSDAVFTNTNHWKAGSYLYETGEYIIDPNKIRYDLYCKIDAKEYMVMLPGGYLKMNILELDQNGKAIVNNDLQSGQKWKKSDATVKIAITVYGNKKTFTLEEYKKLITGYPAFGLKEYVRYVHNTVMKNISAGDFVNAINVGWNLGNSLDSTSSTTANLMQELNWGNPYITKDLIDFVAKSGFNTIRIPVTWYYNSYRDENGALQVNVQWLNRVQDVVDYAIANKLYVIINSHHDQKIIYAGTDDATMEKVLANAKELWKDIAEHFKTYDEHLVFESFNEVDNIEKSWNYSDKSATQMNKLNQVFVDSVRGTGGNNTNRVLIVATLLNGADSRFYSGFQKPMDVVAGKIAVELHTYSKKFIQDIESDFAEMENFSDTVQAPIIIGEFGSTTTYPLPELRTEHASNFVARAAEHGIKCIWWDNGSDYSIIDRRDFSASKMDMINALLEGSKGIGYQVEKVVVLNKPEQFVYLTPNITTGVLKNTYWGTLTTDLSGSGIKVQGGPISTVSLKAMNEAAGIWLQRILFYDAAGVLAQTGKEIQAKYYIGTIPDRAATARVSFNNPNVSISLDNFKKYLNNGSLELSIGFFHADDVERIQLTIGKYE